MEEQLVSFETAKLAKEKGFVGSTTYEYKSADSTSHREYIPHNYNSRGLLSAPTQSLLQRWLREVHKINVEVSYFPNIEKYRTSFVPIDLKKPKDYKSYDSCYASRKDYLSQTRHDSYENALEEGLQGALKLI